jgi:membrane associated rhomboid family serine protease
LGSPFGSETIAGLAGRIAGMAPVAVRFAWGARRPNGRGHLTLEGDRLRLLGEVAGRGAIDLAADRAQVIGWQRQGADRVGLRLRATAGGAQTPLRALEFANPADSERLVAWLPAAATRGGLVRRWYEERLGPYRREAWATYAIALAIAACYVLQALQAGAAGFSAQTLLAHGANFPPRTLDGEGWRLLSAVFLHADFGHLLGNLVTLVALGPYVERLYGRCALAVLFVGAGLAGSALDLFTNFSVVAVGASGAVFGIVGALLAYPLRRPGHLPLGSIRAILAFGGLYTAWSLKQGFDGVGINNSAHVTGLAAGFALGLALAPPFESTARTARLPMAAATALLVVLVACAGALAVARRGDDFGLSRLNGDLAARASDLDSDCQTAEKRALRDPGAGIAAYEEACVRRLQEIEAALRALAPRDQGMRQQLAEQLAVLGRRRDAHLEAAALRGDAAAVQPADAARDAALRACRSAVDALDRRATPRVASALRRDCVAGLDRALALLDAARPTQPQTLRWAHASRTAWRSERARFERVAVALERGDAKALRSALASLEAPSAAFDDGGDAARSGRADG